MLIASYTYLWMVFVAHMAIVCCSLYADKIVAQTIQMATAALHSTDYNLYMTEWGNF